MEMFRLLLGGLIGFIFTVGIGYAIMRYKYRESYGFLLNLDDDEIYG
jgi:hypothetical protein